MQKKNRFNIYILIAASVLMFFLYNYLNFFAPRLFNSPDENANFAFIEQFAKHTSLRLPHAYDYTEWSSYIHPRSTFADFGNYILPVGFWGIMVMYGMLAKLIGVSSVVYATPLFTIVLAWSLYFIWKKIFDERTAFFAALLLLIHPVVWYYSARSLLPNMPFVSFLGIGAFFLFIAPISAHIKKYNLWWVDDLIGISFILRALLIRPNESIWVIGAMLIAVFACRKYILLKRLVLWAAASIIFFCVFLFVNNLLYSSATGGYVVSNSLPVAAWYSWILPFGFHPIYILNAGYVYFVKMYWWLVLPSLIGILFFISNYVSGSARPRKIAQSEKAGPALGEGGAGVVYFFIFVFISLFLFVYYGSNPDISFSLKTIGVAYSRYWLPIHILSLPFIFIGFRKLAESHNTAKLFGVFPEIYLASALLLAPPLVFSGIDGLRAVRGQLTYMEQVKSDVLENSPKDAIIVTDREDKFFWPDRAVMVRFYDPAIGKAISGLLVKGFKVYYFTPRGDEEKMKKVESYMGEFNVSAESVKKYKDHELFLLSN